MPGMDHEFVWQRHEFAVNRVQQDVTIAAGKVRAPDGTSKQRVPSDDHLRSIAHETHTAWRVTRSMHGAPGDHTERERVAIDDGVRRSTH